MRSDNQEAITILNNLIATCKDSENGYRSAQQEVASEDFKKLFDDYLRERSQFAAALLTEAHRLDVASERQGSTAALIHRGWMNLKAVCTRRDASAIIRECARGEHAAVQNYEDALRGHLPDETRALVQQQHLRVQEAFGHIWSFHVLATLNDLVEVCEDGKKGYHRAAQLVREAGLQEILKSYGNERGQMAEELHAELERLGDSKPKSGSWSGVLHRGWMNVKIVCMGKDAHRVLVDCERGESSALHAYERALTQELSSVLRTLVTTHHDKVQAAHAHIHGMVLGGDQPRPCGTHQ